MPDPIDPNALKGLYDALRAATPKNQPSDRNPFSIANTTSNSKYLEGLTYGRNPDLIKAQNQGFWDSMGNAAVQTVAGVGLEAAEGAGYIGSGVGNLIKRFKGEEIEFGNSFSTQMKQWNEQLKKEGAPIYTTPDNEGFKPWDYKWWASNMPSIASAISLAIPAYGAVKGIGLLGKAMGMAKLAAKVGITTAAVEAGESLAMAGLSRHMENMMEGVETFDTLKQQALDAGKSENEAVEIASKGANDTYMRNWPLVISDIIQFGTAFKSFKNLSRINSIEEAVIRKTLGQAVATVAGQAGLEAGEEAYQFIANKEAQRTAAIQSKIQKDDYTAYGDRLMKYVADGDFWTSAFMGAIGGAAFEGAASMTERNKLQKEQIKKDAINLELEQQLAVAKKDPVAFAENQNQILTKLMLSGIEMGRADKVEEFLTNMKEGKIEGDENDVLKKRAETAIEDLKYLENIYNNIFKDPSKINTPELVRFELANRAQIRNHQRLSESTKELQTAVLDNTATERKLNPLYVSLLQAETELDILNNEFKDESPAEKDVRDKRVEVLTKEITLHRDTIKTNESIDDVKITGNLDINKSLLRTVTYPKVMFDLRIDQLNKDYDKLQSTKGREEVTKQVSNFKDAQKNKDFKALTDQITPQSSLKDLKPLKEAAKQLGKEKEFGEAYNRVLTDIRKTIPKYNASAIKTSLEARWKTSPFLAEHEVESIRTLAISKGVLSEEELTPEVIAKTASTSPGFAVELAKYFGKADTPVNTPKKKDIKKQPITENKEEPGKDAGEAIKVKVEQPINRNAWNLQGLQFKMPGGIAQFDSPIKSTIDWKFLNEGNLPLDAELQFEYNFDDDFNKGVEGKIAHLALFNAVYYIDGNINNKQTNNRKVVGMLSAYVEKDNYETIEAKVQLKTLRERLYSEVVTSGFNTGVVTLPFKTKVSHVIGGRYWKSDTYSNPLDILKAGEKLTLAIAIRHTIGNESVTRLETNGSPLQDRITPSKVQEGSTYMIIQAPSGDYLPYKMYTKKVKELADLTNVLVEKVQEIKTVLPENKEALLDEIRSIAYINDISYGNGVYNITTGGNKAIENLKKEEELPAFLGEMEVQIDVKQINKGDYNQFISNLGALTTDINSFTHFHSTKVAIQPVMVENVQITATPQEVQEPSAKNVKVGKKGKKAIQIADPEVGATDIHIGKGKPSLVVEQESYTPIDIPDVKAWFTRNLPQVDVSFTDNLIEMYKKGGAKAWGVFEDNAAILYKGAPKGTEHHEAFHAVFNLLLTDQQKEVILNEGSTEEELANEFERYVQQESTNSHTLGYNTKNFFKKLWDFILSIFSNDIDVGTLFFRINTGFYANKELTPTNTRRYKPVTDPYTTNRNVRLINHYFFETVDQVRQRDSLGDLSDTEVIKSLGENVSENIFKLYQNVYKGIVKEAIRLEKENQEASADELYELATNFLEVSEKGIITGAGDLYMLALKDLRKYGIAIKSDRLLSLSSHDSQTDDQQNEINEEEDALEGWQIKAIETNGKDSLSFKVRRLLRQTSQYTINENKKFVEDADQFGFKQFINFDEIYNYIERNLADIYSIDEMLERLDQLKWHRPELHGIIERLNKDSNLKSQFFTNFAKNYVTHLQVFQKVTRYTDRFTGEPITTNNYRIYNGNRSNINQLLIDDWNLNLSTPSRNQITEKDGKIITAKAQQFIKEYQEIVDSVKKKRTVTLDVNEKISNLILNFGIDISADALQKEFAEKVKYNKNVKVTVPAYNNYINLVDLEISKLLKTIAAGVNPYKGDNSESTTAKDLAKKVAENTPTLHQDTFINVEGKQIYSYLLPTFLNKKLADFRTVEGRAEYLNNWWFKSNKWLQDLDADNSNDLVKEFNMVLLDGLLRENKKGKKYFGMTDQELDITDLNMFDNYQARFAYYRLPILSDSPQAPYIKFKKYSQDEVVSGFYQLALGERDRIALAGSTDIKIKNWNDEKGNGLRYQFVPVFNDESIDINNEESAKSAIRTWLEKEGKLEQARLIASGVLDKNGRPGKNVSDVTNNNKDFLRDYFYNKVFANAMMTQLLSVDLAYYKNFDDFQKRNGQIYKFTKMIDVNANWNGFTPEATYNTIYIKDNIIKSEFKEIVYKDLIEKGYKKDYATKISKLYDDVNQTDAQTYTTVDRYRKIQIGLGEWTDTHEKAYKDIKKGKEVHNPSAIFKPIKPFYFGHERIPGTDIIVPVQNKNSEIMLLPQFVKKSKVLKSLLKHMEDNAIDSVQFTSSVKVGEYGATTFENIKDATIHVNDNKYFGVQQETPEHHLDTENLFASQVKKLIIADIPDNAMIGKYTKKEITDLYQRLLSDNIKESYDLLLDELGTIKKVQDVLLEQVLERNLGEYYERALEIKNGKFALPLYHPVHAKRFESILNAVVRNRVIKQKINGGSFALVSNFGLSDQLKVVMGKDGGVDYMEVMLPPWTKKWFPRKSNGEVDFDAIKEGDSSVLELFGYRIPTEHKYSMKKLKVVGFTPEIMGGVALMPAEITKIAGEDFDIDKLYAMIPNFEEKNGVMRKKRYDLGKIEDMTKEQRDNALMDIMKDIWSSPAMSDQILIPGNFDTLKELAEHSPNRMISSAETENPILPRTQMDYFVRNTTGSDLIGIAANHNSNHAITQFTDIELAIPVLFNGKKLTKLNIMKALDGKLISRNLAEFLAAFVDNAKDPVANDLNLNTFTFDTVAMIVRLGYDLNTAINFITQPAIQLFVEEYYRNGGTRNAEKNALKTVLGAINKNKRLEVENKIHNLNSTDIDFNVTRDLTKLTHDEAENQLKILYTFTKYRDLANSLGKLVRATKSDTLGTRKSIAGNTKAIQDMRKAMLDKNLKNVIPLFKDDIYPLIKNATLWGLVNPQNEILSKHFPFAKIAYTQLYEILENNKGEDLTEDEINFVNAQSLIYYTTGFGYFNMKEKHKWVNDYPELFSQKKNRTKVNKFEIMKYLRFVPKGEDNSVDKIEFVSGATISNEQRTLLQGSWEAMLASDDKEISKVGRDLVRYSFFTNGMSFSYGGFSHLIPTNYIELVRDKNKQTFADYLYKLQDEAENEEIFSNFVDQLFRHEIKKPHGLLPRLNDKEDIVNKIYKKGVATSLIVKKDALNISESGKVLSTYFKYGTGKERTYVYSGLTTTGDYIFNVLEQLGEGNIYEYNIAETVPSTVIAANKLPDFDDNAFYSFNTKNKLYQVESVKDLEIKYNLIDITGNYKSYGKDGMGASSTKAYRKLIEDLAKINRDIAGTGFKAIYAKQADGKGNVNWVGKIVDEYDQLESNGLAPDEQLNEKLKSVMRDVGIKVEYFDDLQTRLGLSASGMADLTRKLIKISKKGEGLNTLPEEVGHFAEAYNRGTSAHSRLMELVVSTPIYAEVVAQYGEEYGGNELKLKQEAVGKLIGSALIQRNKVSNTFMTFITKLWNDFISLFKKVNEITLEQEIEDITGKIADEVLEGKLSQKDVSIQLGEKFYKISTAVNEKAKKILEDGIDSVNKKIKIYQNQGSEKFTSTRESLLIKLQSDYNKKNYELGLTNYIINAKNELMLVVDQYKKIEGKTFNSIEDKADILDTLTHINDYVRGFAQTLKEIGATDLFEGTETRTNLAETNDLITRLSGRYHEIAGPILVDVLKNFNSNKDLDVAKALAILEKDISWTQRWLDAMAEASAPILQILDIITKNGKQNGRAKTLDFRTEILKRQIALEKAGIPSTSFAAERDFAGNATGRYVTEYNIGEFKKQEGEFWKQLNKKYPDVDKLKKADKQKRGTEIYNWYKENTQERKDRKAYIESKLAEFKNKFSPVVAQEKFEKWKNENTSYNEFTHEDEYRGELQQPADKYLSTQYKDIQKNLPMKEYLNFITNHIESNDQKVEPRFRLNGFLPQLKKDFQDRLFVYDKDGRKSLKSIGEIGKETKGSIQDTFRKHENDTEFGITDENGKPLNLIPLHFTKKLADPNQMSLDISSSMTAYMYSFNEYTEMSNILGVLTYAKDALAEQEVLTGSSDFVTLMSNKFITNKKGKEVRVKDISIKGSESNAFARLETYMKMNIYGQQNVNEQISKIADLINNFTSLNSLALNLYTGVSNVLTGNAMLRQEAMAKEFVTPADYAWANLQYLELSPQSIRNIGQRLPDDKLSIWNDRMDTFQAYEKDYRDIEADRSSLAGRLIQTSSLYFINHAGEHMLQSRMSLALAHNTKVKDLLGKELNLWDAATVVDGKLVFDENLTKVGGTSATSLFSKEEDGQPFTARDINRFINRQNSVNKSLNGIYNNVDKAAAQQFALFRLGVMFRKYIKPGWNRRFQKKAWNYEAEIYREGYYTTAWNFIKNMRKELKEGQFSLGKQWSNLTPTEKANFNRLAVEWAYVIATAALFTVLSNWADDDDDNALLAFSAYEAARLYSEIRFFTSITEAQRILKSPAASINQLEKLLRYMEVWNYGDTIESGKFKGYTVLERNLIQTTPIVGTWYKFRTPSEQLKYYSNQGLSPY